MQRRAENCRSAPVRFPNPKPYIRWPNIFIHCRGKLTLLCAASRCGATTAQRRRNNTVPSDKPTRFRMSFGATNTVLPNKRAASPAISQDQSPTVACITIIPQIDHFLAKHSSGGLPYSPARNLSQNLGLKYRTLRQINTVRSGKKLPYSPTN
jgi:hypothetical protein